MITIQLAGSPAALAMIGLGKIRQLEVGREGLRDLIGRGVEVHFRDCFRAPGRAKSEGRFFARAFCENFSR